MAQLKPNACPDCDDLSRRDFLGVAAAGALTAGGMSLAAPGALAAPTPKSAAETAVKQLYDSLTDKQREVVVLPWSDARRTKISANWKVTNAVIGEFFTTEQQGLIDNVFKGLTSEEGYERFHKQLKADYGGFKKYAVAIFGKPGDEKFEFEMTGRHFTIRADGNTTDNAAFGGPIVYGHGQSKPEKNLWYYQSQRANAVFDMLDGKQRKAALLPRAPKESAVQIRGPQAKLPGLAGSELSKDQQGLVLEVLGDILKPYREEDVEEALQLLEAGGGADKLHISFYASGDIGDDGFWDVWRLESPTLVCHFRGSPHVHAYINIAKAETKAG